MKGDANIDFIISIVLFLSFIVFSMVVINSIVIPGGSTQSELHYQGVLVSGMIISKLAYEGRQNILDQSKLDSITNCSGLGIPTTSDYYYEVNTKVGTWSCKPSINISADLPYVQRPVYVKLANGIESPGVLKVWAWPKVT